jgi:hypothetical protein
VFPRLALGGVLVGVSHDAFHSTGFAVALDVALGVAALVWLGLAYRTSRDAGRRIADRRLAGTAALLGLVPVLGPLAYLLFRPPETLAEIRARELEVGALEARLRQRRPRCPVCRADVGPAYLVCPVCTTPLRRPCAECEAPLEPLWQACPYCTTPVAPPAAPTRIGLDAALTARAAANGNGRPRARTNRAAAP